MIDVHSHIIFDIDDGADDIYESVTLCRQAYDNGYSGIVATPHFNDYDHIEDFADLRDVRIEEIQKELEFSNIKLDIYAGCELYLRNRLFTAGNLDALTINNSRYMLCEFPLGPYDFSTTLDLLDELCSRGYEPILAHPERYYQFHDQPGIIDDILDMGCHLQVNIDSLTGGLGRSIQKMAVDLVRRGYAEFIASDAHDPRHRNMQLREKFANLPEGISKKMVRECIIDNPKKVILNESL